MELQAIERQKAMSNLEKESKKAGSFKNGKSSKSKRSKKSGKSGKSGKSKKSDKKQQSANGPDSSNNRMPHHKFGQPIQTNHELMVQNKQIKYMQPQLNPGTNSKLMFAIEEQEEVKEDASSDHYFPKMQANMPAQQQ